MSDWKEKIEQLVGLLDRYNLRAIALKQGDWRVEVRRDPAPHSPLPSPQPVERIEPGTPIPSPMSGIFYRRPSPTEPPFVEEGDLIVQGQTLGLIEAMKVFNEIESPLSGILLKFCVEEGKMVREGETLCLIKPQEGEAR